MGHMQAGLFDGFQVKFISNQSCPLEKLMVLRSRGVLPLAGTLCCPWTSNLVWILGLPGAISKTTTSQSTGATYWVEKAIEIRGLQARSSPATLACTPPAAERNFVHVLHKGVGWNFLQP